MEEQGNSAAMQTYIRNHIFSETGYVSLSGAKFSGGVLSTCILVYLSCASASHLDIFRFNLTIQPINFGC